MPGMARGFDWEGKARVFKPLRDGQLAAPLETSQIPGLVDTMLRQRFLCPIPESSFASTIILGYGYPMVRGSNHFQIRRAADRFHSNHGWLDSYHTFSFAGHDHPDHRGFGPLRVINDDTVAPGRGFGSHPHQSMEIFSYVISGELEHKDSMGHGRVIKEGEFQYLSAGNGVIHSEFNPSSEHPVHFLQIWLQPRQPGGEPRYHDYDLRAHAAGRPLTLIASPDGRDDSIAIRADGEILFGHLQAGESIAFSHRRRRHWIHLISGELALDTEVIKPGDGVAIDGPLPAFQAPSESSFFLFSL